MQKRTWTGKGKKIKYNNSGLIFTYREAQEEIRITSDTFNRAIKKLVGVGFIDIEHRGNCYDRDPSIYALSERWQKFGTSGFKNVTVEKVKTLAGFDAKKREREKSSTMDSRRRSLRHSKFKLTRREPNPTKAFSSEKNDLVRS